MTTRKGNKSCSYGDYIAAQSEPAPKEKTMIIENPRNAPISTQSRPIPLQYLPAWSVDAHGRHHRLATRRDGRNDSVLSHQKHAHPLGYAWQDPCPIHDHPAGDVDDARGDISVNPKTQNKPPPGNGLAGSMYPHTRPARLGQNTHHLSDNVSPSFVHFHHLSYNVSPSLVDFHHLSFYFTINRRDLLKKSEKGIKTARRKSRRKNFPATVPAGGRSDIPRVYASIHPTIATPSGTE